MKESVNETMIVTNVDRETAKKKDMSINEAAAAFLANPNEKTYGVLWERSWWGLRQKIHEIVKDNDMVEEIAIATLQKVWEKRGQYNADIAKFSTWMYRICINEALGYKIRKQNEKCVDNDISELYSKTMFQGGQSDAFCDDADKFSDKFSRNEDGDIRMLDYEGIVSTMVDTSVNIINEMKDERVKICMIEKNRSVFWPIIESNSKYNGLVSLIKKDDNWELVKNDNMKLEDIAKKYSYPLSSVKNWLHKGKLDLDKTMKTKNQDLYEMWQDVK
jgi:DNA-directed RNA polymerase specialized sigma24 family protein